MQVHPLLDLSAIEIKNAAWLVRQLHRDQELVFKAITLEEPPKEKVLRYFKAQQHGSLVPRIPRVAFAAYYIKGTVRYPNFLSTAPVLIISRIVSSRHMSI